MSFRNLVLCIALLAVFTMAVRISADTDTWWHLAAGRWMVENGQLLTTDPFSLTRAGQAWTNPSWLAQLLLYGIYQLAGLPGLNVLTASMVTLAFACVWPLMDGPALLRAFVIVVAATASGVYWSARPQIISFALTGACLLLLERGRRDRRLWFGLPFILALWANVHGGFVVGLLLIAIYLAGEIAEALAERLTDGTRWAEIWARRRGQALWLSLVLVLSAAAVSLNPYGPRLLRYPLDTVAIGTLQSSIDEWQSPDFHHVEVAPFLALLLGTMMVLAASPRRKDSTDLLLLAALTAMALVGRRNIALFALGIAPILGRHLWAIGETLRSRWPPTGRQVPPGVGRVLNVIVFTALAVIAVVKMSLPLSDARNAEAVREQQPLDAIAYLQSVQPAGPLFNSYTWGGYLIWSLWPTYRTFVDGRTDLFGDEILGAYLTVWNAEAGWRDVLQRNGIRLVLVEGQAPIAATLAQDGWRVLYSDSQAVVLAEGSSR